MATGKEIELPGPTTEWTFRASANGRGLVTVYQDGSVKLADGVEPEQAARAFWASVGGWQAEQRIQALEATIATQSDEIEQLNTTIIDLVAASKVEA